MDDVVGRGLVVHQLKRLLALALVLLYSASLHAQAAPDPVLFGTVYGEDHRPLAGAQVVVDEDLVAYTGADGNFRVSSVGEGRHVLTVSATGFRTRSFRFVVHEASPPEIDLGAVIMVVSARNTSVLGVVRDASTGQPIPAAVITIDGTVTVATNVTGSFRVTELASGRHLVHVKRIGYKRAVVNVDLPDNQTGVELDIRLEPVPVELPAVVVEGERTLYAYGRLKDFYERRSRGVGHFITRWDIEKRLPRVATDVLRGIGSLRITPGPLGLNQIELADPSMSCRSPIYFLDGTLIRANSLDEVLTPQDIEGIEIYTRISEIPLEFSLQSGSACGVIAVWTR